MTGQCTSAELRDALDEIEVLRAELTAQRRTNAGLIQDLAKAGREAYQLATQVTRLEEINADLEHLTLADDLTGLRNRRWLLSQEGIGGLVLLDLDGFKGINDTYGHGVGDEVLVEAGRRLDRAFPGQVARLGGDEFAVVAGGPSVRQVACQAQWAITDTPIVVSDGTRLLVFVSAGYVDGGEVVASLERADLAMYHAKRAGAGPVGWAPGMVQPDPADRRRRRQRGAEVCP